MPANITMHRKNTDIRHVTGYTYFVKGTSNGRAETMKHSIGICDLTGLSVIVSREEGRYLLRF